MGVFLATSKWIYDGVEALVVWIGWLFNSLCFILMLELNLNSELLKPNSDVSTVVISSAMTHVNSHMSLSTANGMISYKQEVLDCTEPRPQLNL